MCLRVLMWSMDFHFFFGYKFDYYLILELDLVVYKILGWLVIVCSPRSVFMFNRTVVSSMFDSLNVRRFCVPDGLMYFYYFSLLQ